MAGNDLDQELRDAYRNLMKAETPAEEEPAAEEALVEEAPVEETVETPVEETAEHKSEQARDKSGRFAKQPTDKEVKAGAKKVEPPKEGETPAEGVLVTEEKLAPVVDQRTAKAPSSWSGAAQKVWEKLPPEVRNEVHKREADFHKGLEAYRSMAQIGQTLDGEIRPYEAMIRASGTTPQALIRDTFNTLYILKTGQQMEKQQMLLQIAAQYGVDMTTLSDVADTLASGQPAVDPNIASLRQELEHLKTQHEAEQRQREEAEFRSVLSETEQFGVAVDPQGQLLRPHFEAVRQAMGALISSGQATDLQDAYDKACRVDPAIFAQLQAKQRADERKQAADRAAAARKAASTNVQPRGTPPAAPKIGTMEDTLRATLDKLRRAGEI